MGVISHFTLPANEPASTPSERLAQYTNRRQIAAKVGGAAAAVLVVLVVAIAATEFSEDAPGWLRALAIVLLLVDVVGVGRTWAGFHWKAVQLERRIESSLKGKKKKKRKKHTPANNVVVEPWPKSYEIWWTGALYVLLLDLVSLAALAIWSVT